MIDKKWQIPVLDRAGQQVFWDRQAKDYDLSKMTIDNEGELNLVSTLCRQFQKSGYMTEDVVTLGGAVGSRDPQVVLDVLSPTHVYFNDLSPDMAEKAFYRILPKVSSDASRVRLLPGPIHEIAERIPKAPRRVIIGVYKAEALITANPHYGHPTCGLDTYNEYADTVGTRLTIDPMHFSRNSTYTKVYASMHILKDSLENERHQVKKDIRKFIGMESLDSLRVVGTHKDQPGYFLSHWFTENGILKLIEQSFDADRLSTLSIMPCAKGFVICIDPVEKPRGIVTMLNNVIGNIIPYEHLDTLRAINALSS